MPNTGWAFATSLALHVLLAGCLSAMVASLPPPPPAIRLDFTLLGQIPAPEAVPDQPSRPEMASGPEPLPVRPTTPTPPQQPKAAANATQAKTKPQPVQKPMPTSTVPTAIAPRQAETAATAATTIQPASAPASGGVLETDAIEAYRRANFSTIRNAILSNLRYPAIARRHGWSGKVEIAFLVTPEGGVGDLRVQRSSGHEVLDEEAMAAIRRSAPFASPRMAARLVMPVTFELN